MIFIQSFGEDKCQLLHAPGTRGCTRAAAAPCIYVQDAISNESVAMRSDSLSSNSSSSADTVDIVAVRLCCNGFVNDSHTFTTRSSLVSKPFAGASIPQVTQREFALSASLAGQIGAIPTPVRVCATKLVMQQLAGGKLEHFRSSQRQTTPEESSVEKTCNDSS